MESNVVGSSSIIDGSIASTDMASHESSHPNEIQPWNEHQIVLVLVGLVASGKSTFAQALQENIPQFRRCNQDDLGDRKAVERLARASLRQGFSICIDRTNFDETQRAHWIKIAREIPGTKIWCIILDTPTHICKERLQHRTDHPTIHSPEVGIQTLYRLQRDFIKPSANEGFERIFHFKPADHSLTAYSKSEIESLLVQVAMSPPPQPSPPQRGIREFFDARLPHSAENRGSWRDRGGRGRGRVFLNHNNNFGRFNGRGTSFNSPLRSGEERSGKTSMHSPSHRGHRLPQTHGGDVREAAFQDESRVGRVTEPMLPPISQTAPDRATLSKQTDNGTASFPILID